MKKKKPTLSRREFIIGTATILGSAALAQTYRLLVKAGILADSQTYLPLTVKPEKPTATETPAVTPSPTATLDPSETPEVTPSPTATAEPTSTPGPLSHRVTHVRHASATNWNGTTSPTFFESVNQTAVNSMVQSGLQALTGLTAWGDIWDHLFTRITPSGYVPGQKIAIKVNFNNSRDFPCGTHDNTIDALPQPVIGLLTGLNAAGVQNSDIIVFDASGRWGAWNGKPIPDYFRNPISSAFPGVQYVGRGDCSGVTATTYGVDPSLTVNFSEPGLQDRLLADVLYQATYLINMPILKRHGGDGAIPVSLGFKNHLGSIDNVWFNNEGHENCIHAYINTTQTRYNPNASPLVTIYQNPNVGGKTMLTLGDGLFGAFDASTVAINNWSVFGGPANSLFFAMDPVAIDCVMADVLRAEGVISTNATYDFMFCAETANLGVCEGSRSNPGGNPFQLPYGSGYSEIDYVRQDLS